MYLQVTLQLQPSKPAHTPVFCFEQRRCLRSDAALLRTTTQSAATYVVCRCASTRSTATHADWRLLRDVVDKLRAVHSDVRAANATLSTQISASHFASSSFCASVKDAAFRRKKFWPNFKSLSVLLLFVKKHASKEDFPSSRKSVLRLCSISASWAKDVASLCSMFGWPHSFASHSSISCLCSIVRSFSILFKSL